MRLPATQATTHHNGEHIHEHHAPLALQSVLTDHTLAAGSINIQPADLPQHLYNCGSARLSLEHCAKTNHPEHIHLMHDIH